MSVRSDLIVGFLKGLSMQSCPPLCGLMDCSQSGSIVHGISQVRTLEWVAIPSPGDLEDSGAEPGSSALQADSLLTKPPEANCFIGLFKSSISCVVLPSHSIHYLTWATEVSNYYC